MGRNEEAILKTLLYADIFNFPLKKDEIWKFLISKRKISKPLLFKKTQNIDKFIDSNGEYLYVKGRNKIVNLRKEKERISAQKLIKAKGIINKLVIIPTVKLIGISGALSMSNSVKNDDIDIFVICKKDFIWLTRFLIILILIFFGRYRYKNSQSFSDKICLNMLLDEQNIRFKKNRQNLYTAHEIAQLIPIINRNNSYEKFILKNSWIRKYLANLIIPNKKKYENKKNLLNDVIINICKLFLMEEILKFIQIKYMKKSITKEVIEDGYLAFHPFDYNDYVLKTYNKKIKKYKI